MKIQKECYGHQFLSAIPNTKSFKDFLHQGKSVEDATQLSNENLIQSYFHEHHITQVANLDLTKNNQSGFSSIENESSYPPADNPYQGLEEDGVGTNFDPNIDLNDDPSDFGS